MCFKILDIAPRKQNVQLHGIGMSSLMLTCWLLWYFSLQRNRDFSLWTFQWNPCKLLPTNQARRTCRPSEPPATHDGKNIERQTAHTILLSLNPKPWQTMSWYGNAFGITGPGWPFVRGIYLWIALKTPVMRSFDASFCAGLHTLKLLNNGRFAGDSESPCYVPLIQMISLYIYIYICWF